MAPLLKDSQSPEDLAGGADAMTDIDAGTTGDFDEKTAVGNALNGEVEPEADGEGEGEGDAEGDAEGDGDAPDQHTKTEQGSQEQADRSGEQPGQTDQPVKRRPGRKKDRATVLKEEGLAKTNNGMDLTSWPQVAMINQKNYYTEYLKRDEQFLSFRSAQEQAARTKAERDQAARQSQEGDGTPEQEAKPKHGSRCIVIHPGSQNLRIGFAHEALPKTVPMVIARRVGPGVPETDGIRRPYRAPPRNQSPTLNGDAEKEPDEGPESIFGPGFSQAATELAAGLKRQMKANKRRMLPNSRELVVNFNKKTTPVPITEHNDAQGVEWTEVNSSNPPPFFIGDAALRIVDKSNDLSGPGYRLFWPIRHGLLNEGPEYEDKAAVWDDLFAIIEQGIRTQLGLNQQREWKNYSVCFVIPDLYDRDYVTKVLDQFLRVFEFSRLCFFQESVAATFGAGYSQACIVDVGAQSTTICCVEDGLCVEDSRVRLSLGGGDVTDCLIRFALLSGFPYADIDLARRQDWIIAEDLKRAYCTLDDAAITTTVTARIHVRAPGNDTLEYSFKMYDEPILAALTLFEPDILAVGSAGLDNHEENDDQTDSEQMKDEENSKLPSAWPVLHSRANYRRRIFPPSFDIYDGTPNDPFSSAQGRILQYASVQFPRIHHPTVVGQPFTWPQPDGLTKSVLGQLKQQLVANESAGPNTPRSVGSPAAPSRAESSEPNDQPSTSTLNPNLNSGLDTVVEENPLMLKHRQAEQRDRYVPVMPIDEAVSISIAEAARGDDRKARDLLGSIMLIGGGSAIPGFTTFLQQRLKMKDQYALAAAAAGITFPEAGSGRRGAPAHGDPKELVIIGTPPRDMDPQVVVWKGGSVFARLSPNGNECWITGPEYELLGAKMLAQKSMWNW